MNRIKRLACVGLIFVFLFTGSFMVSAADYLPYLNSMIMFVKDMYYKDMSYKQLLDNVTPVREFNDTTFQASLKGLVGGLDKYSAFYTNKEMEDVNNSLNGNYVGVGAGLEKSGSYTKIIKVYEGSPAEKAGLLEGDLITAVDGKSVLDKDAESVASMVRGNAGTAVKLTIKRGSTTKVYSIVRGTVTINPVQYRIEGNIAYIRIDSFGSGSAYKFSEALAKADEKNIRKIILDLRGNPGGYVNEAVDVARKLIPPGVITTLDYKSQRMTDQVFSSEDQHPNYFVAVLVDKGSASASEILAGAIQDSGCGVLIGQNTYGKGIFQNLFPVLTPEAFEKYSQDYGDQLVSQIEWLSYYGVWPADSEILGTVKLTTGHYLTPNGRSINGVGLKPDMVKPDPIKPNGIVLTSLNLLTNTKTLTVNSYDPDVLQAESILRAAGYYKGTPDKQFDPTAQAALKSFQTGSKLPTTGVIDAKTRDMLNKTLQALRNQDDQQYASAVAVLNLFK